MFLPSLGFSTHVLLFIFLVEPRSLLDHSNLNWLLESQPSVSSKSLDVATTRTVSYRLTGAVFIDLRKAFDSVNHEVLLNKLRGLGVLGGEHEWFRNYLQNRTQIVEFQGVPSAAERGLF